MNLRKNTYGKNSYYHWNFGQDGSYLAELLLKKNYKIYGICKKSKKINFKNIEKIKKKFLLKKLILIIFLILKD